MKNDWLLPGYDSIEKLEHDLRHKNEDYWIKRGERATLKLFHRVASRVPAYKDYLKKHKVSPEKIKTIADFQQVPPTSKEDYLKKYPLEKLCWDGKLKEKSWVFSATSGTTGEPFYFPRQDLQDLQYALTAELYLRANFQIQKKSTLYIDCFAMGAWIGGLFTYEAIKTIAERGNYQLSIITPGTNKAAIIQSFKKLAPHFDQVILGGYPPFIKDTIDEGEQSGINWKKFNVGIVFSAEGFTENFRDYFAERLKLGNILTNTLNHYGTVDLGTMAHETPLSILVRRLVHNKPELHHSIFSLRHKLPTLTQYLPEMFYFEKAEGVLLCSVNSGLPLVRYNLHDRGDLFTKNYLIKNLADLNINLKTTIKKEGITATIWNLPFVSVYERDDFMVKLQLYEIHPEHIRDLLLTKNIKKFLTGKFMMMAKFNNKQDQYLELNLELNRGITSNEKIKKIVHQKIINTLAHKAGGPGENPRQLLNKPGLLKIILWPYEHTLHFQPGGKQKWVKK